MYKILLKRQEIALPKELVESITEGSFALGKG